MYRATTQWAENGGTVEEEDRWTVQSEVGAAEYLSGAARRLFQALTGKELPRSMPSAVPPPREVVMEPSPPPQPSHAPQSSHASQQSQSLPPIVADALSVTSRSSGGLMPLLLDGSSSYALLP